MFARYENLSFKDDLFNLNNHRNIHNTPRNLYNCGGYALETFSWYCPQEDDQTNYWLWSDPCELYHDTATCVEKMLADFTDLRVISDLRSIADNEYGIAFRLSSDGDFHYVKRDDSGHWHHKRGGTSEILTMTTLEVFTTRWCNRYDGPIVLLAKRKSSSR